MKPGWDEWSVDIRLTILGEEDEKLWMQAVPCNILKGESVYFDNLLKKQTSLRAKVVLPIVGGKEELQKKVLKELFHFMLQQPMNLTGPPASKRTFWVEGVSMVVLLEIAEWTKYLGMVNAADAVEALWAEVGRRVALPKSKRQRSSQTSGR
jgi:hypothetical protein